MDDFEIKLEKDVLFALDRIRTYERNKAIDDFAKKMNDFIWDERFATNLDDSYCYVHTFQVNELAAQLKAGGGNEE